MSKRPGAADDSGLVPCLICRGQYRSLGPHLYRAHGVSAADYRAQHGLPATAALMAPATREALSAARRKAMETDPDLVGRMRAAGLDPAELARRSSEARARTDRLPQVRNARRRGWDKSVAQSAAARREGREEAARRAGFVSWEEAIEATRGLPSQEAAERLGMGRTTVKRWRRRILPAR
ncbi:MucR family transcriptional regulator [Streptomyces sp. NPDC057580]|uniref:MucR family transcriptional regulator n=1 Tax=Streptomyces sp. NPDC057580 TaxID=3346173 RepID=UPI00368A27CB